MAGLGRGAPGAVLVAALLSGPARAGLFPTSPFSDKAAGTTGASFLKNPPSAHANALADAYAAAAEGSEALFWNPAGMASLEDSLKSDLTTSGQTLLESSTLFNGGYARAVSGLGVFGVGLLYAGQGGQQGYSAVGDPTSKFAPNDLAFSFGYAKKLDLLRLGGGLKLLRSQVADVSGTTFALDLGVQTMGVLNTTEGPIDLGVAVLNLGPAMSIGSGSDPLPFRLQMGARWHISDRISALLDGFMPVDQDPYAAIGVEGRFPLGESLAAGARGGYNVARTRGVDGLAGLTAGFGVEWNQLRLDYAWVPYGDLGVSHRFTLGISFDTAGLGRDRPAKRAAAPAPAAPPMAGKALAGPLGEGEALSGLEREYWTNAVAAAFQANGGGRPFNPQLDDYSTANGASQGGGGVSHIIGIVPSKETLLLYESDCDLTRADRKCGAFTGMVFETSSRDAGVSLRGALGVQKGRVSRLQPGDQGVWDSFKVARRYWLEKGRR